MGREFCEKLCIDIGRLWAARQQMHTGQFPAQSLSSGQPAFSTPTALDVLEVIIPAYIPGDNANQLNGELS
jgi:hypothetical protein